MPPEPNTHPDAFSDRLLDAQERQHQERMEEARQLRLGLSERLDKADKKHDELAAGQGALSDKLTRIESGGLGSWERRGLLTGGLVVLLLLILLLAESRGVDSTKAVDGVRELAPASTVGVGS